MKVLFIMMAAALMTVSSFAQKVTEESLKGSWKIVYVAFEDNVVDLKADKVVLGTETIAAVENGGMGAKEFEAMIREQISGMQMDFLPGHMMKISMKGEEPAPVLSYTLSEKDGKQYLGPDGENTSAIRFDGSLLIVEPVDDEQERLFKFERTP